MLLDIAHWLIEKRKNFKTGGGAWVLVLSWWIEEMIEDRNAKHHAV